MSVSVVDDVSKYKRCSKKLYNVWFCMPPLGSVVINKLERPDVVKALNNKVFLLPDEVNQLKNNANMYNYVLSNSYVVTLANRFVISGTYGELWTISAKALGGTYRFADRSAISLNKLLSKCENKEDIHSQDDFFNKGIIDWHLLETKPSCTNYMAQFIPKSEKFQLQTVNGVVTVNDSKINIHGKGDFVVCPILPNNQPDLSRRYVVFGDIFTNTYNNQGWTEHLDTSHICTNLDRPNCVKLTCKIENEMTIFFLNFLKNVGIPYLFENVLQKYTHPKYSLTRGSISDMLTQDEYIEQIKNNTISDGSTLLDFHLLEVTNDDINDSIRHYIFITSSSVWIVLSEDCYSLKFSSKEELKEFWSKYRIYFWFLLGFKNNNVPNLFEHKSNFDARKIEQGIALYCGGSFKLNGILAGEGDDWDLTTVYKNTFRLAIESLDYGMDNSRVTHDLPVIRSISYLNPKVMEKTDLIPDTSYKSTTYCSNFGLNWGSSTDLILLMNLKGRSAIYARNTYTSKDEHEIIGDRRYSFKKVGKITNFYLVDCWGTDALNYDALYVVDLVPTEDKTYQLHPNFRKITVKNHRVDLDTTVIREEEYATEYERYLTCLSKCLLRCGYNLNKLNNIEIQDDKTLLRVYESLNINISWCFDNGYYTYSYSSRYWTDKENLIKFEDTKIPIKCSDDDLTNYAMAFVNDYTSKLIQLKSDSISFRDVYFQFDILFKWMIVDYGYDILKSPRQEEKSDGNNVVYKLKYTINGNLKDLLNIFINLGYKNGKVIVSYRARGNNRKVNNKLEMSIVELRSSNDNYLESSCQKVLENIIRGIGLTSRNRFNKLVNYANHKNKFYLEDKEKVEKKGEVTYKYVVRYNNENGDINRLFVFKTSDWEYDCMVVPLDSTDELHSFTISGFNSIFEMYDCLSTNLNLTIGNDAKFTEVDKYYKYLTNRGLTSYAENLESIVNAGGSALNVWYLVEASGDFEKYHQDFTLSGDHCDSVIVSRTYKRDNTWVDLCYYVESDKLGIVIHIDEGDIAKQSEGYDYLYDDVNGTSIGYYNFCSDIMSQFGL